ncbi:MAG TPA: hypothetical protein VFG69_10770 [Nannocystaceae bacterium]|nr:hypothetical protein [Nannocystaceae bacterium]
MSTSIRRFVLGGLLAAGCASDDGDDVADTGGSDGTSTAPASDTTAATTVSVEESSSGGGGEVTSGDPSASDGSTGGGSTGSADAESGGSETAGEVVFDEDFLWVADFLRGNCVTCHSTNVNGNLLLPAPDITNDEVRLALDGVVATTGLLLVEPGDRTASQTYLQITNEFGAIFPVEDTDRFGAWIDAGAHYFAE